MMQDLEVMNAFLQAGTLLQETFVALERPVVPLAEKIERLEALLTAQRTAYQLAAERPNPFVKADDLVQPLLNTLSMLADSYDFRDRGRADELRSEAAKLVEGADPNLRIQYLRSLAGTALGRGEFAQGLVLMERAEELLQSGAHPRQVARVIIDRADMLQQLGDFEAAAAGVERVREMDAQGQLDPDPAAGFRMLEQRVEQDRLRFDVAFQTGLIERGRGHYEPASAAIEQAALLAERMGQPPELIRFQLARIGLQQGDATSVDRWIDEAEPTISSMAPQRLPVIALLRGWALLLRGDAASAARWLEVAREGAAAANDAETHGKASWRLAQAQQESDPVAASAAYRDACQSFDKARRAPLGYRLDNWYLADKYEAFVDAISWFNERAEADLALASIELVKSRRLTATLATAETASTAQSDQAAELLAVTRRLDAIAMGTGQGDAATRQALESRRQELIVELRRDDPRYRNLTLPPLDTRQLQRCLGELEGNALELFMPDDLTVIAILVTPAAMRSAAATLSADTRSRIDAFISNLRQPKPIEEYYDISGGLGVGLSDLLPTELIADAFAGTRLLIAPHRELHVLPWSTLRYDDDGQRVCERTAVGIVPCLSCIPALAAQLPRMATVQFFGPPQYSDPTHAMDDYKRELDAMAASLPAGASGPSRGPGPQNATVDAFLELLARNEDPDSTLLVACHGRFDPGEPLRSALSLSDGYADAANIMLRRTGFEEIILRACSTGDRVERVGELELLGDDILGLPGAFIEAGARSVLVSIPPLVRRPTTRRLFERYLERRQAEEPPVIALAAAQRSAIDGGDDVVDWAGVTVYGVQ